MKHPISSKTIWLSIVHTSLQTMNASIATLTSVMDPQTHVIVAMFIAVVKDGLATYIRFHTDQAISFNAPRNK